MHPDFICIGMQKAGTTWLYDQADSHPECWMPPLKEVMYWGGRQHVMQQRVASAVNGDIPVGGGRVDLDERDRELLKRAAIAKSETIDEYISIFEPAGTKITGDISPLYAKLTEREVRELVDGLPGCRFLLLLREPGARLWSNANMAVNTGKRAPAILADLARFQRFANAPGRQDHNHASGVIRRWREIAGDRFGVFVMDDLVADPATYRRAVFAHIGLDGNLCKAPADLDRKAGEKRVTMTEPIGAWLDETFAGEREALKALVGGATLGWH